MANPEECGFCDWGTLEPRLLYMGKLSVSFLADPRLTPGHSLVIPARHIENPADLDRNTRHAIEQEVQRLQLAIVKQDVASGWALWQEYQTLAPEGPERTMINHVNTHVIPRPSGDGPLLGVELGADAFEDLSEEECEAMRSVLAKFPPGN